MNRHLASLFALLFFVSLTTSTPTAQTRTIPLVVTETSSQYPGTLGSGSSLGCPNTTFSLSVSISVQLASGSIADALAAGSRIFGSGQGTGLADNYHGVGVCDHQHEIIGPETYNISFTKNSFSFSATGQNFGLTAVTHGSWSVSPGAVTYTGDYIQDSGATVGTISFSISGDIGSSLPADLAVVSISNPPAYLHIGPPPFPIGPSSAFPIAVTDTFTVLDTVRNSGSSFSTQTSVSYYLSQSGERDYPLAGTRSVPPVPPGGTNSNIATASVPAGTPAGKYFVLACVASACVQSSTKALVIDFESAVQDSVSAPDINEGLIVWSETPNFQLSAKQAAELGGFDHLNWKQDVVSDSAPILGLVSLGTDPALGGNIGQRIACTAEAYGFSPDSAQFDIATKVLKLPGLVLPRYVWKAGADYFNWYNNEQELGCQTADAFFVGDVGTRFVDNPDAVIPTRSFVFETYLAGVYGDGTGRVLAGMPGVHIHWKYTQHIFGGSIGDVSVGIQRGEGPSFGASEFLGYINPEDFTPERVRRLKLSGTLPFDADVRVSPTRGPQSETMSLAITGGGTHFVPGVSSLSFSGLGIVVNSFAVVSPVAAVASITIAPDALPFARDVYVATGDEVAGASAAFVVTPVTQVGVVLKPGDDSSSPINPAAKGNIPVAILSTPFFSAVDSIRADSLTFGRTGTELQVIRCHDQDINGDGLADLLCQFDSAPAGFHTGDTTAILRGLTVSGDPLKGMVSIRLVPR